MTYEIAKDLKPEAFKRLTGVRVATFETMLIALETHMRDFGRPPKLSRANQLLLTLQYYREYRTLFHVGGDFGVSEATACRTVQKVEKALLKAECMHLPGKKALLDPASETEILVVDATECRVQRPKKNNAGFSAERRKCTLKRPKLP